MTPKGVYYLSQKSVSYEFLFLLFFFAKTEVMYTEMAF